MTWESLKYEFAEKCRIIHSNEDVLVEKCQMIHSNEDIRSWSLRNDAFRTSELLKWFWVAATCTFKTPCENNESNKALRCYIRMRVCVPYVEISPNFTAGNGFTKHAEKRNFTLRAAENVSRFLYYWLVDDRILGQRCYSNWMSVRNFRSVGSIFRKHYILRMRQIFV